MDCKDCIHEKVCVMIAFPEAFENTKWEKEPCDHFKSKAEIDETITKGNKAIEFIKYLDRNYSSYMTEDEKFGEWR